MYIRFTTLGRDEDSHSFKGVFQAAFQLRDSGTLAEYEETELLEALDWLKLHLKSPAVLKVLGNQRAISWFQPRAFKPMKYIWQIVHVLQENGIHIQVLKTTDPGEIIYEDGWQIVAKPWRGKRRR